MSTERDDRLRRIYQMARTLRRRRLAWVGGSAVAIVLAAGTAVSITPDRDGRSNVATDGAGSTTSTSHGSTSTTVHEAPASSSTTSTSLLCRNSTNPACGPFRYDPPPPDLPPTITLSASPSAATVGAVVTITVTVHEPDGPPGSGCRGTLGVDMDTDHARVIGSPFCSHSDPPCMSVGCPARYGPWDPPSPGDTSYSEETTFDAPGEHEISYWISDLCVPSRSDCGQVAKELMVTVAPAPVAE